MTQPEHDAFDRGVVAQRLDGLDARMEKIDIAIAALVLEMSNQTLALQQLRDLASSNARHDFNQDAKLKDVREASHASTERLSWIIGGAVGLIALLATIYFALK